MTEYDNPWKEVLDCFFQQFMQLCFPEQYSQIDWKAPAKMLDKSVRNSYTCALNDHENRR